MKHAREDYQQIQDPSGKIPEDEPVFLLRAQDRFAPAIVSLWANLMFDPNGSVMSDLAATQAARMRQWQRQHGSKTPGL